MRVTDSVGAFAEATLNIIVLGFGLRTHLLFENNTNDALGNANGIATGSPVFIAGRTGQSLVLDAVDDGVTLPDGAVNYQDITIATWIYWDGGSAWQRIFDFGDGTTQYLHLMPRSGTNTLRFAMMNGGGEQVVGTAQLTSGRWNHVAITLGGSTATLQNGPAFVAGTLGNAVSFDGADDRVTLPAGAANSADITIAAWVWWNGGAASQRIFSFADDTSNFLNLSPSASAGKLKFGIRVGGATEQILTDTGTVQTVRATLAASIGPRFVRLRVVK